MGIDSFKIKDQSIEVDVFFNLDVVLFVKFTSTALKSDNDGFLS
jgi:hypothetical protein